MSTDFDAIKSVLGSDDPAGGVFKIMVTGTFPAYVKLAPYNKAAADRGEVINRECVTAVVADDVALPVIIAERSVTQRPEAAEWPEGNLIIRKQVLRHG
jgi:hypothetical protein